MQTITHKRQIDITRAIINLATMLLEYGADSYLVELSAKRVAASLGVDSIEMSMIPSAIVLTTLCNDHCITTTRRVYKQTIDMTIVCYIQKMVIDVEEKNLDECFIINALNKMHSTHYNRWLIVFMVGLSCAAFAHLQGGDVTLLGITFLASAIATFVRQEIHKKRFAPYLNFGATGFVATLVASLALHVSDNPEIALASSVLLLFPGFPFINSFSDSFKGYLGMGWGRLLQATLLTFSVTVGIILATYLVHLEIFS